MIAEIGHAALWLAAAFAALQLIASVGPQARIARLSAPAAFTQAALLTTAFACLIAVFENVDLSVEAVIAGTEVALPPLYRLAAIWAGWPGTLLLAATSLALAGALAALNDAAPGVMARFAGAGVAVLAVLLGAFDPFVRAMPPPTTGNGLAAALQTPAAVAPVPLLVAGLVALVAAVAHGRNGRRWAWSASALLAASAAASAWSAWHDRGMLDANLPALAAWLVATAFGLRAGVARGGAWLVGGGTLMAVAAAACGTTSSDGTPVAGHDARLVAVTPVAGANWTAIEAEVAADGGTTILRPQWRDYPTPPSASGDAATAAYWNGSLAVTVMPVGSTRFRLALAWRPMLPWLWLGAAAVVAGGVASAAARGRR